MPLPIGSNLYTWYMGLLFPKWSPRIRRLEVCLIKGQISQENHILTANYHVLKRIMFTCITLWWHLLPYSFVLLKETMKDSTSYTVAIIGNVLMTFSFKWEEEKSILQKYKQNAQQNEITWSLTHQLWVHKRNIPAPNTLKCKDIHIHTWFIARTTPQREHRKWWHNLNLSTTWNWLYIGNVLVSLSVNVHF